VKEINKESHIHLNLLKFQELKKW